MCFLEADNAWDATTFHRKLIANSKLLSFFFFFEMQCNVARGHQEVILRPVFAKMS